MSDSSDWSQVTVTSDSALTIVDNNLVSEFKRYNYYNGLCADNDAVPVLYYRTSPYAYWNPVFQGRKQDVSRQTRLSVRCSQGPLLPRLSNKSSVSSANRSRRFVSLPGTKTARQRLAPLLSGSIPIPEPSLLSGLASPLLPLSIFSRTTELRAQRSSGKQTRQLFVNTKP
ncbi:hypothetical protein CYLTODRAFT_137829 [Cylindrobasidium torrendii FP15055 ss-10]|uniref:Uncharacterized protein n=1 Tax=Cylindrobasidium torrendii FP15055 ss-10 TaxID=1314674 RepID=A0A0D7AZS8_9AGAR|nr:hypothetical protein CYLTODRAFT_137829 [Cylindrobasidium torrendii FP15055 ss-10]